MDGLDTSNNGVIVMAATNRFVTCFGWLMLYSNMLFVYVEKFHVFNTRSWI
jgi:hypothetical protein